MVTCLKYTLFDLGPRSEVSDTLGTLCHDIGVPDRLQMDRALELVGKGTDFYKLARKRHINLTYAGLERENQISPVDVKI